MTTNRTPAGVPTGGQFASSAKSEASVALTAPSGPPPYDIVGTTGPYIRPGDQVRVGETARWAEVSEVAENPTLNMLVAACTNGYLKALPEGKTIEVVRGDEHGIPALTDTIWNEKMSQGYDSGAPERVEWCDECADYEGASESRDEGPARELCHGCEDRRINEYVSNGGNL